MLARYSGGFQPNAWRFGSHARAVDDLRLRHLVSCLTCVLRMALLFEFDFPMAPLVGIANFRSARANRPKRLNFRFISLLISFAFLIDTVPIFAWRGNGHFPVFPMENPVN